MADQRGARMIWRRCGGGGVHAKAPPLKGRRGFGWREVRRGRHLGAHAPCRGGEALDGGRVGGETTDEPLHPIPLAIHHVNQLINSNLASDIQLQGLFAVET